MSPTNTLVFSVLSLALSAMAQTYSATYLPSNAPKTTEQGQSGTNQCGTDNSQTSMCQNAYINNIDDWCIWAPPNAGPDSVIGNTERIEVAWCIKPGYGTRLIPDGAITGAHFVKTPDFVQVTGVGDLTKINIPKGDAGGELDPHGADGNGNPIGGLVFSNAFGDLQQLHEWTNFVSDTEFCFRACKPGPQAPEWCQHIYDVMGCDWNMPANYDAGVFEQCNGDSGEPMGVYGGSTFFQGQPSTPPAHPIPSSSQCTTLTSIGNSVQFTASPTTTGSGSTTSPTLTQNSTSTSSVSTTGVTSSSGSGSNTKLVTSTTQTSTSTSTGGSKTSSGSSTSNTSTSGSISVASWNRLGVSIAFTLFLSTLGAFMII